MPNAHDSNSGGETPMPDALHEAPDLTIDDSTAQAEAEMKRNVIVRAHQGRFLLLEADTGEFIGPPADDFLTACKLAMEAAQGGQIWREDTDWNGRPYMPHLLLEASETFG